MNRIKSVRIFLSSWTNIYLRPEFNRSRERTPEYQNQNGSPLSRAYRAKRSHREAEESRFYLQLLDRPSYHAHPFHSVIVTRGNEPWPAINREESRERSQQRLSIREASSQPSSGSPAVVGFAANPKSASHFHDAWRMDGWMDGRGRERKIDSLSRVPGHTQFSSVHTEARRAREANTRTRGGA